jgi:hypothetical protein
MIRQTSHRGWRSRSKARISVRNWVLLGCGLLVVLAGGGFLSRDFYVRWQERRFLATGAALLQKGDYRGASIAARAAREFNSQSAAAYRILATIAERQNDRSAIALRGRIAELERDSPDAFIDWARTALRFRALEVAERALAKAGTAGQKMAAYHELAAELAEARDDHSAAEVHLSQAVAIDPSNLADQLKLAVLQLHSPDESKQVAARTSLETLRKESAVRTQAAGVLLSDALEHKRFDAAVKLADEMEMHPDLAFADRLSRLTALHKAQDPRFPLELAAMSGDRSVRSAHVAEFIEWMATNKLAVDALNWVKTLGPEVDNRKGMSVVLAPVYVAVSDWAGLERLANQGEWSEREFLRRAYLALALRQQGQADASRQEQVAAVNLANVPSALQQLARLFAEWGWKREALELYWRLVEYPQTRTATLQKLYAQYTAEQDAKGLYQVMLRMAAASPEDLNVQNNVAQLSLLLGMNSEWAHKIAANVYEKNPNNPAFASTYGFSCYLKGEKNKALRVFRALPEAQQRQPDVAAYYGIILTGSGEHAQAREFLALAETASLLPEERALVVNAQRTAASRR